jgi:hypothetical protein
VDAAGDLEHHVAATAAVPTVGSAPRFVRLAVQGRRAVAAAAGAREHGHLVDERHTLIVTETPGGDEDGSMPEPTVVWAVETHLGPEDRRGTLTLERDCLLFLPDSGGREIRIALADVRKARRLRGSPVLMVVHAAEGRRRRTAFYFVQPPPLEAMLGHGSLEEQTRPSLIPRSGRRRARKQNVGYLGTWNRSKKHDLLEWQRAVREALRAAGAA